MTDSSLLVRQSTYRNIYGEPTFTSLNIYENAKVGTSKNVASEIKCNGRFFAFPWHTSGIGSIMFAPIPSSTKCVKFPEVPCLIAGHSGVITDFEFYPFNDRVMVTTAMDGLIRLWTLPDDGLLQENMTNSDGVLLANDGTPASRVTFHPLVSDLMITAHQSRSLVIWDMQKQYQIFTVEKDVHEGSIESITTSGDGSTISTASCDKMLRFFDLRADTKPQASVQAHGSTKGFQAVWLGNEPYILTSGFTSGQRELSLFDRRSLGSALKTVFIDNGSLPIYPYYVPENKLVFLCGKGDRNIKTMEMEFGTNSCNIHHMNDFSSNEAHRAIYPMPRSKVDVRRCEVARFIKLTPQNSVQSLSMIVPRKNLELFHEDLYPNEPSDEPVTNVSTWSKSQDPLQPKLISRKPENMESIYEVPIEQGGRIRPGAPTNEDEESGSDLSECEWDSDDQSVNGDADSLKIDTCTSTDVTDMNDMTEVTDMTDPDELTEPIPEVKPRSGSVRQRAKARSHISLPDIPALAPRSRQRSTARPSVLQGSLQQMAQQYMKEEKVVKYASYLLKKNPKGLAWKKRWFTIDDTTIFYFEDKDSSKSLGKILLTDILDVTSKKDKFVIKTSTGRSYKLAAETEQSCSEWTLMIRRAVFKQAKRQSVSSVGVENFDLCGKLKKLGVTGGWRRRYFDYSPEDHTLSYRVKPGKPTLGRIHLDRVLDIETTVSQKISKSKHHLCFQIVTGTRNFILQAEDANMHHAWTSTLKREVEFIRSLETEEQAEEVEHQQQPEDLDNEVRGHLIRKTDEGLKKRWLYFDEKVCILSVFCSQSALQAYMRKEHVEENLIEQRIHVDQIEAVDNLSALEAKQMGLSPNDTECYFAIRVRNNQPSAKFLCPNTQLKQSWIESLQIIKDIFGEKEAVQSPTTTQQATESSEPTTPTTTQQATAPQAASQVQVTTPVKPIVPKVKKTPVAEKLGITDPTVKARKDLPTNDLTLIKQGKAPCLIRIKDQFVSQVALYAGSLSVFNVYVLDCGMTIYQWNGRKAHRLDKAKGLEVSTNLKFKERGGASQIKIIDDGSAMDEEMSKFSQEFWTHFGGVGNEALVQTINQEYPFQVTMYRVAKSKDIRKMITEVQQINEGIRPSKDILNSKNVYVVDAKSELYVWVGKSSTAGQRSLGLVVAEKLMNRPEHLHWVKVTRLVENAENTLWKEKFNGYPGMLPIHTGIIETRGNIAEKKEQENIDVEALLAKDISAAKEAFVVTDATPFDTQTIKIWRVFDFAKYDYPEELYGQFYSSETFLVLFSWTEVQKPVKQHIVFFWQGQDASTNMKGTSALLSVNIDDELDGQATQIRVEQNKEPEFFLKLFKGKYTVHKRSYASLVVENRLYDVRGTNEWDVKGIEIDCEYRRLNSMHSFVLSTADKKAVVWHGCMSNNFEQHYAGELAARLNTGGPVQVINEGDSNSQVFQTFFNNTAKRDYIHLSPVTNSSNRHRPRIFLCSQATGVFTVDEIMQLNQEDLNQENCYIILPYSEQKMLFVWIGRNTTDFVKRYSLNTAHGMLCIVSKSEPISQAFAVHGGKEAPEFYYSLHGWSDARATELKKRRSSIAPSAHRVEVNNVIPLDHLMQIYCQVGVTYPYQRLLRDPLPEGVDPNRLDAYLNEEEFLSVFDMHRSEFNALPLWKQQTLKKKVYLF